ncbi:putative polyprotein [Puccinia sorghi]|uniref:Putative polyprotein n=1 Tax=Puccinia sorghi TaxID=27349 RepID=A0A0L6VHL9_9BASI|nr:putative polyprotein [Puccinia sorghi]
MILRIFSSLPPLPLLPHLPPKPPQESPRKPGWDCVPNDTPSPKDISSSIDPSNIFTGKRHLNLASMWQLIQPSVAIAMVALTPIHPLDDIPHTLIPCIVYKSRKSSLPTVFLLSPKLFCAPRVMHRGKGMAIHQLDVKKTFLNGVLHDLPLCTARTINIHPNGFIHSASPSNTCGLFSTRPEISFAMSQLSQNLENLGASHWQVFIHLLRYIKGTQHYAIHPHRSWRCLTRGVQQHQLLKMCSRPQGNFQLWISDSILHPNKSNSGLCRKEHGHVVTLLLFLHLLIQLILFSLIRLVASCPLLMYSLISLGTNFTCPKGWLLVVHCLCTPSFNLGLTSLVQNTA